MQRPQTRGMCAFDGRCQNPQCSYIHAVQRPNRDVCHYGGVCSNRACWRFHMCRKPVPPKTAPVLTQMTHKEAELFRLFLQLNMKDEVNDAEAEMLELFRQMSNTHIVKGEDETEVDEAFGEFLDGTDKDLKLDDYAAEELDALEELEEM